ncbi:hypothetical protein AJ79_01491 [Helicocarpus griseus UAMH5409]|uniref:Uncharacterized protein n=1 Tax=Helicocarpus griseus UAMH5409 TaxID=1447875 RepID=A0A2B7Y8A8_9EURO|nr:hypothetical protein AJ79_01491 [Helicocarpus griseus UAMH5409]
MTSVLLFCIAEEAKPFMHKILKVRNTDGTPPTPIFYLVESNICPSRDEGFKEELQEDESFESDFVGASEEQCKSGALEKQFQVNFIEQNIIAIADARTARDGTILMCFYKQEIETVEPLVFEEWGPLPPQTNTWYDFRIDYQGAALMYIGLVYCPPDSAYPAYFGRREQLTDEHGVFDVVKADRYVSGEDPEADA